MRKLIGAINMSLDGFCDHTGMIADDELHKHYNEVLRNADTLVYGRITYQLMESYWPAIVNNPTGNKAEDEFAGLIDNMDKVVFSRTLDKLEWKHARLARGSIKEELLALKQQEGNNILIGSPSLIATAIQLNLIDEFQLCVHPVIAGSGLPLFKNINERKILKLIKSKILSAGQIVLYYEPIIYASH